jgi:putative addiction module antidote
METKLRKIGNSIGVTLPKEILDKLDLKEGDTMNIVLTTEGIKLTAFDPNFETVMEAYKEGKAKYRNAMRKLADG